MKNNAQVEEKFMWLNMVVACTKQKITPVISTDSYERAIEEDENNSIKEFNKLIPSVGYSEDGKIYQTFSVPAKALVTNKGLEVTILKGVDYKDIRWTSDFVSYPELINDCIIGTFITGNTTITDRESFEKENNLKNPFYFRGFYLTESPEYFVPKNVKAYLKTEPDKER